VALKHSHLDSEHRALGAKMTEFGGWEMPLSYPGGTLTEHRRCRSAAVAFDVSHLGTVEIDGGDSFALLQAELTNDLRKIRPGRAQYSHLLDPADASVLDDVIVWWLAEDRFHVMPNASNTERVRTVLKGRDTTDRRAVIAVQGPTARTKLATRLPQAAAVSHFAVTNFEFRGATCVAAGTGYTGEDGVEIAVPADRAVELWREILACEIEPAGLGARDTLRLEAALPLHSHELGPGITPLQAGLGWVIGWDKGSFRGRAALEQERKTGPARRLRAICSSSRRPPHSGDLLVVDGREVGVVTSGNFSPHLERGIALGFLPPQLEVGASVQIASRDQLIPAKVVQPPFHRLAPEAV
jgi:aminomethyltransferase